MHRDKTTTGQNSGLTNATTKPNHGNELHAAPPTDKPQPTSGKRDIREPESPRREEEIREPNPDEQETDDAAANQQNDAAARTQKEAAAAQRRESHREAAIEENPPRDEPGPADRDSANKDAA